MNRRTFVKKSSLLTSGALIAGSSRLSAVMSPQAHVELKKHVIDRVEFGKVEYHWPRLVGKNARLGIHGQYKSTPVAKLYTSQGATAWGMASHRGEEREIEKENIREFILGKTVDNLMIPSTGISDGVNRALDIALHDLAGIILNKPVYKLLGGDGPLKTDIYSGMIYFDELEPENDPAGVERVMANCLWDYDYGYRQLKVKIGRSGKWYPHDEGLAMDIRIVKMIHEEFGEEVEILVDANNMYSLDDTIAFLEGVEGVPIYWMEEPFHENLEEGGKLKKWMMENGREDTYYADGEANPDHEVCMQLASEGKFDVYLPDVIGRGFTSWRKLMPELKNLKVQASPHAWGTLLKSHYAAHLSAGLGNICTIEGVTCLSEDVDFGDYPIVNGKMKVSEKPGFGMKLLKELKS